MHVVTLKFIIVSEPVIFRLLLHFFMYVILKFDKQTNKHNIKTDTLSSVYHCDNYTSIIFAK